MDETQFEWDEAKDLANQKKHGISFRDAARVFSDPLMLLVPDGHFDGEERWCAYGQIGGPNWRHCNHHDRPHLSNGQGF